MIVEDESDKKLENIFDHNNVLLMRRCLSFDTYTQGFIELENVMTYFNIRVDLIEHLWAKKGNIF
jgi:hypothetical protein